MKKILISSIIFLSFSGIVFADSPSTAPGNSGIPSAAPSNGYSIDLNDINPLGNITLQGLIDRVANWAVGLLIAISILFMIYAAYLFMFAGANPSNVQTAKNIILYTVIAIVVALLSRAMLSIVTDLLTGSGSSGASNYNDNLQPQSNPNYSGVSPNYNSNAPAANTDVPTR